MIRSGQRESTSKLRKKKVSDRSEMLQYYSLLLPVMAVIFVFCYVPMYGLVIAFQDYFPGSPFIGEYVTWVGLDHFVNFIRGEYFLRLIGNTLYLSILNLLIGLTGIVLMAVGILKACRDEK